MLFFIIVIWVKLPLSGFLSLCQSTRYYEVIRFHRRLPPNSYAQLSVHGVV